MVELPRVEVTGNEENRDPAFVLGKAEALSIETTASVWCVSCGFMIASDDLEGLIVLGCCDGVFGDSQCECLLYVILLETTLFALGVDPPSFNAGRDDRTGDVPLTD